MVAEGRQILRNLQRVAKLVREQVGLRGVPDPHARHHGHRLPAAPAPLQPRCVSITIGIPSFLLALAPAPAVGPRGMLRRLARFAPCRCGSRDRRGGELPVLPDALDLSLLEARTVATSVLVLVGLYLILALEGTRWTARPDGRRHVRGAGWLCRTRPGAAVRREYFELAVPSSRSSPRVVGASFRSPGWSSWASPRRAGPTRLDRPQPQVGQHSRHRGSQKAKAR